MQSFINKRTAISISLFYLSAGFCTGQPNELPTEDRKIVISRFNREDVGQAVPIGWRELVFDREKFPKKSRYEVVNLEENEYVLKATTNGGVSAIYKSVNVDPKKYPYLIWRWRVENIYPQANEKTKQGDDYPGRVYIGFHYDPAAADIVTRAKFNWAKRHSQNGRYPPLYVLNYVWANNLRQNTWISNPWQSRSKVVAVKSGAAGLGRWHREIRNYARDFKAIVGQDPPLVDFVAIMIDGDGTHSNGTAYFADIEMRSAPPAHLQQKMPEPPIQDND